MVLIKGMGQAPRHEHNYDIQHDTSLISMRSLALCTVDCVCVCCCEVVNRDTLIGLRDSRFNGYNVQRQMMSLDG